MENGLFPAHLKFHGFCNMIKQDVHEPLAHVQGNWAVLADIKSQEAATTGRDSSSALLQ